VCSRSGLPASGKYCLGIALPKRVPRPAAGTTHQSLVLAIVLGLRVRILDNLIEHFVLLDQTELGARALLDCFLALAQILDVRSEHVVALFELRVLGLLLGNLLLEMRDLAQTPFAGPELDAEGQQQTE